MADGVALRLNQVEYAARDERLLAALPLMGGSGSGLAVREGRRLGSGLECSISADGLNVLVQPGLAVVAHTLASGGDYRVAVPVQVSRALGAKPGAGLKRRDTVVVDVADADVTEKPTALREANIAVLPGASTSGTPTAPAAGAMQFEIGQVAFDGTNTPTIHPTNPRYTWAAGGIGKVYSQAEETALATYDGQVVYRNDLKRFRERVDGAWRNAAQAQQPFVSLWHNGTTRTPGQDTIISWSNTAEASGGASLSGANISLPAGLYTVTFHVSADGPTGSDHAAIHLRRNALSGATDGVELARDWAPVAGAVNIGLTCHKTIRVNDGDTLQAAVHLGANATGTLNVFGGLPWCYLTAVRVAD